MIKMTCKEKVEKEILENAADIEKQNAAVETQKKLIAEVSANKKI